MPDDQMLNSMSAEELKAMINHLKNELTKARDQVEQMRIHFSMLDNLRDIPGENNQDDQVGNSNATTERSEVTKKEIGGLQTEISNLKARLKYTENLNNLLKKQLELNTQTENSPSGFNPELIVKMAQEIDRLKEELDLTRGKLRLEEEKKDAAVRAGGFGAVKKSAIPVRKDAKPPSGNNVISRRNLSVLRRNLKLGSMILMITDLEK